MSSLYWSDTCLLRTHCEIHSVLHIHILLFLLKNFIYLFFIFDCAGSLLLCGLFSSFDERELLSNCDTQASHCGGFSCWGARALGSTGFSSCGSVSRAQAQCLWCRGLVAPRHVGSSRPRDRTCVSCLGMRILYHWVTREALWFLLIIFPSDPTCPHFTDSETEAHRGLQQAGQWQSWIQAHVCLSCAVCLHWLPCSCTQWMPQFDFFDFCTWCSGEVRAPVVFHTLALGRSQQCWLKSCPWGAGLFTLVNVRTPSLCALWSEG